MGIDWRHQLHEQCGDIIVVEFLLIPKRKSIYQKHRVQCSPSRLISEWEERFELS